MKTQSTVQWKKHGLWSQRVGTEFRQTTLVQVCGFEGGRWDSENVSPVVFSPTGPPLLPLPCTVDLGGCGDKDMFPGKPPW